MNNNDIFVFIYFIILLIFLAAIFFKGGKDNSKSTDSGYCWDCKYRIKTNMPCCGCDQGNKWELDE